MIVGKTSSSLSKNDIFTKYSEIDVFAAAFPNIPKLPCRISSPFRMDKHPSFSIFVDGEHIRYRDFGTDDKGSLLDLLCKYWNCTFSQCLDKICSLMREKHEDIVIKKSTLKVLTRKETDNLVKIQVTIRPWKDYDIEYWKSYGIDKVWLKHAEVYPISHKIVTKRDSVKDKAKTYIFTADKYAYAFIERKEGKISLKIYQPFSKDFKWCSKMDASVIGLWTKIPPKGDRVIICSSLKDALCISCNLHIPAICLQGEGYDMSDTAINELKRRYSHIFISFDTDKPGLQDGEKLSIRTGFTNVVPNLGEEKDFSDAFKHYGKEWFIENIKPLFDIKETDYLDEVEKLQEINNLKTKNHD